MRILAIRGANLASLAQEFEIDFRVQPLASAGLFAIVGPTGAGKSTILDAICLAFYGQVPRLLRARESDVQVEDPGGDRLAAHDARQLLRRGAWHGFAEVDFLGIDGVEYRARWEVKRSGRKSDGALQPAQQQVFVSATGLSMAHGKKEFDRVIEAKLGLGYESFTRAVLLAQGDFSKFLQAKTAEKADLLERLTNTEYFSEISKRIFQECKQVDGQRKVLEEQFAAIELLGAEELEELQAQSQQLQKRGAELKSAIEANLQRSEWRKQYEALEQSAEQATRDLAAAKELLLALQADENRLRQWDEAQSVRDTVRGLADVQRQIAELTRTGEELGTQLPALAEQCEQEQRRKSEHETKLQAVLEEQTRMARLLERLSQEQRHLEELERGYAESQAELKECEQRIAALRRDEEMRRQNIAEKEAQRQANGVELAKLDRAKALFADGGVLLARLEKYRDLRREMAGTQSDIEACVQEQKQCAETIVRVESELQSMHGAISPAVLELREGLEEAKPCPVCGSIDHPLAHELNPYTAEQGELRARHEELTVTLTDAKQRELECKARVETLEKGLAQQVADCEALFQGLNPVVAPITGTWHDDIVQRPDWLERTRKASARWAELTKLEEQNASEVRHWQDLLSAQAEPLRVADAQCTRLQERVKAQGDEIAKSRKTLSDALGGKTPTMVESELADRRKTVESDVAKSTDQLRALEQEQQRLTTMYQQKCEQLVEARASQQELLLSVESWLATRAEIGTLDKLRELLGMSSLQAGELRSQLQQARQAEGNAATILKIKRSDLANIKARFEGIELRTSEQLLQEGRAMQSEQEELQRKVSELHSQLEREGERRKQHDRLSEELGAVRENLGYWEKLNGLYGSSDGKQLRVLAQGYTLGVLVEYANEHLRYIMPRYRLEQVPSQNAKKRRTLALQVVDTDLFNEVRPADTLSGGESFLVSLALSLALSELSSSSHALESLFIDEGFGSLDPESLGLAIEALERLQMQGRKVGLISHVQEMNERIAVKIKVKRCGGGRSVIEVGD